MGLVKLWEELSQLWEGLQEAGPVVDPGGWESHCDFDAVLDTVWMMPWDSSGR